MLNKLRQLIKLSRYLAKADIAQGEIDLNVVTLARIAGRNEITTPG